MGSFLVDASAVLAVLLNEPERPSLLAATQGAEILAPVTLPWEIGNALIAGWKRRRISAADVHRIWENYELIPVRMVEPALPLSLEIAVALNSYAYDAYVLAAAEQSGAPLLTLDRPLRRAAMQRNIALVEVP